MFNSWVFYVCLFIVAQIVFLQTFKYATRNTKSIGALTVLIQVIGAASIILLAPFFKWTWPSGSNMWLPWLLLGISFILFAVNDRLDATARKHLDISVDAMLHQSYRILFIPMLIFFIGVFTFAWSALLGGVIIVLMNMFLFFQKGKLRFNKYVWLKLLSVLFFVAALTTQLKSLTDGDFNVPFFSMLSLAIPALILLGARQATPRTLINEVKRKEWPALLICGITQGLVVFSLYMYMALARPAGELVTAHAISAVYVLLNVVFAYIFLKERNNLLKKSICAVVIVACLVMIALKPF